MTLKTNRQSIFSARPPAFSLSGLTDSRSIAMMAVTGALYCIFRYLFIAIGSPGGPLSVRPADMMWMLSLLFGYPWAVGMMIGGFISAVFPMFGGYGLMDGLKEIPIWLVIFPLWLVIFKKFDPKVEKSWLWFLLGIIGTAYSVSVVAIYLNILYNLNIVAFWLASGPPAILNKVLFSYIVAVGLKKMGGHFLPMREV